MRRLVLPTTGFSAREPKGITPPSSPIELPNRPQNGALNCSSDPDDSWSHDLPADGGATLQCTPDPLPGEATSDDPSDSVDCDDTGAQYQPDDTQYQTPAETTCDAPDDSVVPIAEPEGPASSTPGDADATAATDVVPPTTEPAAASVAPDTEPAQSEADVLPAPASPQAAVARKVAESRFVGKPSRPRFSSPKQQSRGEREISVQRRAVTQSVPGPAPSPAGTGHGGEALDLQPQDRGHGVAATEASLVARECLPRLVRRECHSFVRLRSRPASQRGRDHGRAVASSASGEQGPVRPSRRCE